MKEFREAEKYHKKAREALSKFWHHLLVKNLSILPEVVGALDRAEHGAESIYEKLRAKFPKSTKVLRQYAIFLEEVRPFSFIVT